MEVIWQTANPPSYELGAMLLLAMLLARIKEPHFADSRKQRGHFFKPTSLSNRMSIANQTRRRHVEQPRREYL